ncbi:amidase signature domain-containing protein [Penicillium malachiteum]|nr:amidase signature domain-containing protein [Penicillium malachiteum]
MAPADRASLYELKVTPVLSSTQGTLPWTPFSDSVGPLAKSSKDISDMLPVSHGSRDYSQLLISTWLSLRVGFLDPGEWMSSATVSKHLDGYLEQLIAETEAAIGKISQHEGVVKKWVNLRRFGADGDDNHMEKIGWHDYAAGFREFVSQNFNDSLIQNIEDLVDFNKSMSTNCPKQDKLLSAKEHQDKLPLSEYEHSWKTLRQKNLGAVEVTMRESGIDVIIGVPTGGFPTIAAAAGCPSVTLPLGYSKQNGRPFGLMALARPNREDVLVSVTSAWEATFGSPKPPQLPGDDLSRI